MAWPETRYDKRRSWYRVYDTEYAPNAFNPCSTMDPADLSRGGRFHPIDDAAGQRIPTFYMADHESSALAETLLRLPAKGPKSVKLRDARTHALTSVTLTHDLRLVDLTHSSLNGLLDNKLKQNFKIYGQTRDMAASIHAAEPWAHGLVWNGKQQGIIGHKCVMLFGDRVKQNAINAFEKHPLTSGYGQEKLWEAAVARGYRLPKSLRV